MAKIEIFRTGTHTAMDGVARTFGDAELQAIAAGYSQAVYDAPVVVGHPKQDAPAYGWLEGWYVAGGEALPRIAAAIHLSAMEIQADGMAEAVISGIPAGAVITISGALAVPWTPVEGTSVTLTCTEPGRLIITMRLPAPYLEWRGTIDAN